MMDMSEDDEAKRTYFLNLTEYNGILAGFSPITDSVYRDNWCIMEMQFIIVQTWN